MQYTFYQDMWGIINYVLNNLKRNSVSMILIESKNKKNSEGKLVVN